MYIHHQTMNDPLSYKFIPFTGHPSPRFIVYSHCQWPYRSCTKHSVTIRHHQDQLEQGQWMFVRSNSIEMGDDKTYFPLIHIIMENSYIPVLQSSSYQGRCLLGQLRSEIGHPVFRCRTKLGMGYSENMTVTYGCSCLMTKTITIW